MLQALSGKGVEFIIVGGFAGTIHGSTLPTRDLDIVYRRSPDNVSQLVLALEPFSPYLRGAPPGLPFKWDSATILGGLNFTLTTDIGAIDLMGEIAGGGGYERLFPHTDTVSLFGCRCLCLKLEKLIDVKKAAGRIRDLQAVADLQALLEERLKKD